MKKMYIPIEIDFKTIFAFISTSVAIISYIRSNNIKKQVIAHLWGIFQKQQNNFSISQACMLYYKQKYAQQADSELLWHISRSEAFDQNIFEDIMLQIAFFDSNLSNENIDTYQKQGRISEYHAKLFKAMINNPKQSFLDKLKNKIGL